MSIYGVDAIIEGYKIELDEPSDETKNVIEQHGASLALYVAGFRVAEGLYKLKISSSEDKLTAEVNRLKNLLKLVIQIGDMPIMDQVRLLNEIESVIKE
jgi:hypothetical protein